MPGPRKIEGDNKGPAGIFKLGAAFGYAQHAPDTKMSYFLLSKNIVAVDDPRSRFYNQLVDEATVAKKDWESAERMILPDDRYKWGVVVRHNLVPPKRGAGSCIFLHVWKNPETATDGPHQAMPEDAMIQVIRWLDPASYPLLIQLPAAVFNEWNREWHLPARDLAPR